ncbi:MAG: hypothetical protein AAGJ81_00955 [Verrucomicrobiota bacterium]
MNVVARISSEWRRRMLLLFLMIFGMGCWFLTDGYLVWPAEAERYAAFREIADEMIASGDAEDEESSVLQLAWQRFAEEADYPADIPKERTDAAIREQRVIGWSLVSAALLFLAWVAWNHTRSVVVEGEVITGASKEKVNFNQIVGMDRKKWKKKGIAYAIYEIDGKQKKLTLDDHKFIGCEEIILEAERRIEERKKETVGTTEQSEAGTG